MLTYSQLIDLVHYEASTGQFTRRRWQSGIRKDAPFGWRERSGLFVQIGGKRYAQHRLAWLYVHGKWPDGWIDHINGIPTDNRIENLRIATPAMNAQNQHRAHIQSRTGLQGVSPSGSKFRAVLFVNGRQRTLGRFETPELAREVYLNAKRQCHPGFSG